MAAINTLSDKAIKAAIKQAEEAGKPQTVNDGGGLLMIARPEGVGWWRLRYWMATRENRLSLGVYPEVTLAMARQRRDEAKRQIAEGVDPSEARKADKAAQEQARTVELLQEAGEPLPGTFEAVAREWWSTVHSAKVSEGHAARTLIRLEQDAFPWIGARPIAELRAADVLACAQRVVQRGAIETAPLQSSARFAEAQKAQVNQRLGPFSLSAEVQ